MASIKELIQSIESTDSSFDDKLAAINMMEKTLVAIQSQEEQAIQDNVDLIIEAIRVMERKVAAQLEVAKAMVPEVGPQGPKGEAGADGQPGMAGPTGRDGRNGADGKDGADGADGVSVTDARIDFDGSLVITLSTGRELNVGEVVAPDLAEKIKVITNGGGTSQSVLDALDSLQTQINTLIPSQTGNAGKFLTTNGTVTSWATVSSGGGSVASVTATAPVVSSGGTDPVISLAASYGDTQNPYASKTANYVLAAPNGTGGVPTFRAVVASDIPTLNQNTTGTAANVTGTVAIANGGTGATTAANALTALGAYPAANPSGYTSNTGTVTSVGGTGTVNGISLSGTVTASGNLTLGGALSGVSLTTQVSGTLPIANGGTGATTRQDAMDALAGATTSGQYLRGNGTDVVMAAIVAGDVPTLNQNTTGTAANVTGIVAVANGGTGATTAGAAFNALAPTTTKGDLIVRNGTTNTRVAVGADTYILVADSAEATGVKWVANTAGSAVAIADEGTTLTSSVASINFTGTGVTATNVGSAVTVNITSGGGSGTVTDVSVVSANGFAGTVATSTTTPAITLSTSITGVLKGNGTAISAATAGTDYVTPTGTETLTNKTMIFTSNTLIGVASVATTQTLTNKTLTTPTLTNPIITGAITEDVFAVVDGASVDLDPGNGTIQYWSLGANRTATATNFVSGESMTLMVNDGTAYALTWPTITWVGGSAPILSTTGYTVVELWKVTTVLFGAIVGYTA